MLTDAQWVLLKPLIEAVRPKGKTQPKDLRRTMAAILCGHNNVVKWRSVPAELGPWWRAAQTFICWVHLGVAAASDHSDLAEASWAPAARHSEEKPI